MKEEPVKLGLIGASGFIGLRTAEILSGDSQWDVRHIVRSPASLAVLARQRFNWKIANFLSESELASALAECSVCIHAAIGDPSQITLMAEKTYAACALAGVRRLVWLSSASVHGQSPLPGTNEESPLCDRHPLKYNNAKVRAEWTLQRCATNGMVEVVRLRPSIVFGPRSRWIGEVAKSFRDGGACWLERGQGFCNTIYIDNLVHAIKLCATHPEASGGVFLIGDNEIIRWRDFLLPIARHFCATESSFTEGIPCAVSDEKEGLFSSIRELSAYKYGCARLPYRLKRIVKNAVAGWNDQLVPASEWQPLRANRTRMTLEMTLLQQCKWILSSEKARNTIGYRPPISFSEGMCNSLAWLDFVK